MGLVLNVISLVVVLVGVVLQAWQCHGAVYKVGDSAGWTTIGNVDYKLWSATKTFKVGDVIGE
ncbi:hypothetical protein TIFTF001_015830 [Ficus carica]|uniref:Phytocyanin domain-containing protein n=1 Tax=Ficus carica TaxID=3494 RepID=A0AA88D9B6_FICCA|nr:hypothetical protein TIFTF001_015830 [Ficus carica]